ncbi:MAG: TonB-dependent receptor, partial [Caulobacter sp.]|nr:TonB-dependent receptor [Caulobacter sp.]
NEQFENRPQSTGAFTTDFHYTGLENWDFKGVAHYSRGHAIFNEEAAILGIVIPSATLDISNPKNVIYTTSTSLTDGNQYATANLFRNNYPTGAYRTIDSYEDAAQLDVKRYIDYGFLESIAFGGKYRKEVLKRNVNRFDREDTSVPAAYAPSLATTGVIVSNFLDGDNTIPDSWISPNIQAYRDALAKEGYTVYEAFDPQGSYNVKRDLTSFYAMANLKGEIFSLPFRGNVGVRRESTDQTVNGYVAGDANPQNTEVRLVAGRYSTPKSYDNTLPSANFSVDLTDNLLLRFAAAKVLVRPIIDSSNQLATTVTTATDSTGHKVTTVALGQGLLNPLTANQIDVGLEWYYGDGNGLSAGYFNKKVKNGTFTSLVCP